MKLRPPICQRCHRFEWPSDFRFEPTLDGMARWDAYCHEPDAPPCERGRERYTTRLEAVVDAAHRIQHSEGPERDLAWRDCADALAALVPKEPA